MRGKNDVEGIVRGKANSGRGRQRHVTTGEGVNWVLV